MYITLADIESTVRAHQAGLGHDAEEVSIGACHKPDESLRRHEIPADALWTESTFRPLRRG